MYDILVVGAGPAGVSAAIYAASRGLNVAIIEKGAFGGKLSKISTITHFMGVSKGETGQELAARTRAQLASYGVDILEDEVCAFELDGEEKTLRGKNNSYSAKAIILAMGLSAIKPEFEGNNNENIFFNCNDAKERFTNEYVSVVGGSDGAAKEAIYLAQFVKELHLIFKEPELACVEEFKRELLSTPNIILHNNAHVTSFNGNEVSISDGQIELSVLSKAMFVFAGGKPNTDLLEGTLELKDNYILVNEDMQTSKEGVFAAGDIVNKKVRQISTAIADGTIAAIAAHKYVCQK